MRAFRTAITVILSAFISHAQDQNSGNSNPDSQPGPKIYQVEAGKRIPLTMVAGVTTKTAAPGDPVYLETVFPVLSGGRIVIPRGSYVTGTVTEVKRAGKVKGRAELRIRLESLILPTGVSSELRGNLGGLNSQNGEELDRTEGTVKGKSNKLGDMKTVMLGAGAGAAVGAAAGGLATIGTTGGTNDATATVVQRPIVGSAIGMAAGAAAAYTATLFMHGPDAVLAKGTDVEMVLDRTVTFDENMLAGLPAPAIAGSPVGSTTPANETLPPDESGLKRR
jgi:hypothetical protein